ncbi:MAG: 16S rRNA (cytosine(1402)-N(4))-methyltransferase RsmH [Patescibacteria group bacterium]
MNVNHVPVLLKESIEALTVIPGQRYIDATVGAGGHAREIIHAGGILLGIDQDENALEIARVTLGDTTKTKDSTWSWKLIHGNFKDIETLAKKEEFTDVDGILFDLGVSSMQLDTPKRGFSYRFTDAPLDLRMDASGGDTAAQLVNRVGQEELYDIFSTYGEEQLARKLADAAVRARAVKRIQTVGDLIDIVKTVAPNEGMRYGVLSRVFQGIRIAVNDELGSLKKGLNGAQRLLAPGGRLVVISFHSLEDRMVKQYMRQSGWEIVTRHPIRPTDTEMYENSRSRSAKMRVAIKKPV